MYQLDIKNMTPDEAHEHILTAFETIFNLGIKERKLTSALRCLEFLARKYQFFQDQDKETFFDLSGPNLDKLFKLLKEKKKSFIKNTKKNNK